MSNNWDVIVVGAGPGGSLAAKKCAAHGLKTLLVEKKKTPRDKVCSGMVMGEWAQKILVDEFGEIPDDVLVEPKNLLGYAVHVPGAPIQTLDVNTPITWRKRLDYWMNQMAQSSGAEIWDNTRVTDVTEKDGRYTVELRRDGNLYRVNSDFVIGADGARSAVRGSLFPEIKTTYWHCYRECYDVKLDLPERRFNFFSTIETAPFYFCTHDKGGYMLMEGGSAIGTIKDTIAQSRQFLIDHHGLYANIEPLWRDGCVEPILYRELFTGEFRPARGNALIIGDAAGLNMPVTGEGVGTSLKSGLDAAKSIIQSEETGDKSDITYLQTIDELVAKFQDIYAFSRRIKAAATENNPKALSDALLESWDHSLKLY
ncbi:MAG: NAD(P)/FAD-dependent oxidoreductase [Chloroflexi bacterium]|nr:NAD(P)/FAD-dependent oxidoreductase [Chloroflexota bacterium]